MSKNENETGFPANSGKKFKHYKVAWTVFSAVLAPFYRVKIIGRENIPEGACLLCANHSANIDGILLCMIVPKKYHMRTLSKIEIFKVPVVGAFMRSIGMIPVDRDKADINSVKESMSHLKAGGKLGVFPEGTRTKYDGEIPPVTGAVKIADKTNSPVLPVFIPRNKKLFRKNVIIIGAPYSVNPDRARLREEDYERLSAEMMAKIFALKP